MTDDKDILSQLFNNKVLATLHTEYSKLCVKLNEPQESDSSAIIRNLPADALVIKVDDFHSPDNIFNGNHGECKRADYVIISPAKKCILFIELKRTKDSWQQIVKQLKGAQCFISYCQEIGKVFWDERDFLTGYERRFVSIGHTSIAKRKTRVTKKAVKHNTPEKAMKIDWPGYLQYKQLASLGT